MKKEVIGKKATFEYGKKIFPCKVVSMNEEGVCLVEVEEDSPGWGMCVMSNEQRKRYCVPDDYDSNREDVFGYFIEVERLTFEEEVNP